MDSLVSRGGEYRDRGCRGESCVALTVVVRQQAREGRAVEVIRRRRAPEQVGEVCSRCVLVRRRRVIPHARRLWPQQPPAFDDSQHRRPDFATAFVLIVERLKSLKKSPEQKARTKASTHRQEDVVEVADDSRRDVPCSAVIRRVVAAAGRALGAAVAAGRAAGGDAAVARRRLAATATAAAGCCR